jgi:PAP2 superfamily
MIFFDVRFSRALNTSRGNAVMEPGTSNTEPAWKYFVAVPLGVAVLIVLSRAPLDQPFVGFSLLGTFLLFLCTRPKLRTIALILVAAGIAAPVLIHRGALPLEAKITTAVLTVTSLVGMFSLAALMVVLLGAKAEERRRAAMLTNSSLLLLVFSLAVGPILPLLARLTPTTLDLYLYVFDDTLGGEPSFAVGKIMFGSTLVHWILALTYYSITAAIAGFAALELRRRPTSLPIIVRAGLLSTLLGVICYQVYPAAGPKYLMGPRFPLHPLASDLIRHLAIRPLMSPLSVPRNAMPSLHMAWALLIWFNTRPFSRTVRVLAGVYVLLTVLATLGTGEHYFADLVVALPFSLLVQAILQARTRSTLNRMSIAVGALLTVLWVCLLRFGVTLFWLSPVLPWLLTAATVGGSLLLESRLMRQARNSDQAAA